MEEKKKNLSEEIDGKFTEKKKRNKKIIDAYLRIGESKKAKHVNECGNELLFKVNINNLQDAKLFKANFCKDRLCNMCAWRRSMKIFGQVSKIMDKLEQEHDFIFLTLTVRNCSGKELPKVIDHIQKSFKKMLDRNKELKAFKGYFKAIEITHTDQYKDTHGDAMRYHPHIHCIIAVNKSYWHSRDYISQEKITRIWKEACGLDYKPIVNIKKVKATQEEKDTWSTKKAVAESAKYTVKPSNITQGEDTNLIDDTVRVYMRSLSNRRVCSFGGIFKQVAQELKLDDMTDGDLINTNNEELRNDVNYIICTFSWHIGCYVNTNVMTEEEYKHQKNVEQITRRLKK